MEIHAQEPGVREYELIYVLRPNVDNAEAERINGRVSEIVESFGGKLTKLDNWGRRKLAYPMQKHARGLFVYTKYFGGSGVVAEVERTLRITDSVLRHQTVLLSRDVDPSLVEVDPEELKFAPVEEAEPEEEIGLEQRLGLASAPQKSSNEGPDAGSSSEGNSDKSEAKEAAPKEDAPKEAAPKEAASKDGGEAAPEAAASNTEEGGDK